MKKFKFRISVSIADIWIQDGFDLTEDRMEEILREALLNRLGYAREHEIKVSALMFGTRKSTPIHQPR